MHPKRTVKDKRLLMNLMFSKLSLRDSELTIEYSKAFQILSKFVPAWKKFEQRQKSPKDGSASELPVITAKFKDEKPSEPQKKIRTAKNSTVSTQFGTSMPESRHLLREQGSNLRPIAYALSIITNGTDYIIPMA